MQLASAKIENYRSIKSLKLSFTPSCRILVGINESGKSNILSALNLLDTQKSPIARDIREPGLHEGEIRDASVTFSFTLNKDEAHQLFKELQSKVFSKTYSRPIIKFRNKACSLEKLCQEVEGVHVVKIKSGSRSNYTWSLEDEVIMDGWKKVVPNSSLLVPFEGQVLKLSDFALIDTTEVPDIPAEYITGAEPKDLESIIDNFIAPMVEAALPKVLFWNYDETKLLPPRIPLDQFCATPDICLPLKRMFELHKIADIRKEVAAAKAGSSNALNNLLRRVAETTTKHFHDTWSEYAGIKFSLSIDGPNVVAAIEDVSNRYDLSQRSDGFKRFVTFLLMVSVADENKLLTNTLLLIDEPEIGLHPTGARYLMKELIDISKNNYVVFSTHSIFMIDSKIIKRHLITKRKDEITETYEVSESNLQDEEVIYKALGYSIFSNLKERNVIFEGWRDKKLFETALSVPQTTPEPLKFLETIGHCFVRGVKQLENVTPLFEAGDRKCLILTDSDAMAREHQKKYQANRGYGVWKRFDEVVPGTSLVTGEDFLKETAFEVPIQTVARKHGISPLPAADLNKGGGRVALLRAWLTTEAVPPQGIQESIEEIKDSLFETLKASEIRTEYYDYLNAVVPLLKAL